MPGQAPPVRDERDALRAFLLQQQDAFRMVVHGVDDPAAGRAAAGRSGLALGALVQHATQVQAAWLASVLAAPELPDPSVLAAQDAAHDHAWSWPDGSSLAAARTAYDEVCARVLDAVETCDLGLAVPPPPAPWNPAGVTWSVRWVWFHLLEELARHAGHADVVRENLDGATLYPLMAAYEGWPATDWLRPWQPPARGGT